MEMTLGASDCGQCMEPVDVVTVSSGCGQWVWSVGGGYAFCLIMELSLHRKEINNQWETQEVLDH